jgi:hypothetical protein
MREPRHLTTLWAFAACYRGSFTFTFRPQQTKRLFSLRQKQIPTAWANMESLKFYPSSLQTFFNQLWPLDPIFFSEPTARASPPCYQLRGASLRHDCCRLLCSSNNWEDLRTYNPRITAHKLQHLNPDYRGTTPSY